MQEPWRDHYLEAVAVLLLIGVWEQSPEFRWGVHAERKGGHLCDCKCPQEVRPRTSLILDYLDVSHSLSQAGV